MTAGPETAPAPSRDVRNPTRTPPSERGHPLTAGRTSWPAPAPPPPRSRATPGSRRTPRTARAPACVPSRPGPPGCRGRC
ncbi:hypothetical protein CBQ26_21025 [Deinococcus indicus]|uniref:Uncharacterized protein n=1 Tax=Deinococcus indicus TaxID=223556 RepID=A0A246BDM7_9DEIO|nr:hypothetical protein CBQ26_21025 [Deinococcus indicus]